MKNPKTNVCCYNDFKYGYLPIALKECAQKLYFGKWGGDSIIE
jgi:hypothetical protein